MPQKSEPYYHAKQGKESKNAVNLSNTFCLSDERRVKVAVLNCIGFVFIITCFSKATHSLQTVVQIAEILIDDMDSDVAESGDNVKLKLRNVEEEDISAGQ